MLRKICLLAAAISLLAFAHVYAQGVDEIIEIPFELDFINLRSEIDKIADGNILMRGPLKIAKLIKNVKSLFRLEAQASVQGTRLQPFAEVELVPK